MTRPMLSASAKTFGSDAGTANSMLTLCASAALLERRARLLDQLRHRMLLAPDADHVGFEPARIEDAVDHVAEVIDAGQDDLQELSLLLVHVPGEPLGDDRGELLDHRQRRAEVVAGVLDEAMVGVAQEIEPRLLSGQPFDLLARLGQIDAAGRAHAGWIARSRRRSARACGI